MTQFIDYKNKNWDYGKLGKVVEIAVRFMDNVNDISNVPLDSQAKSMKDKRRIGLGIMGYGSALMMLKLRYGSEEALSLTEKLMGFISNRAYQSSSKLAKEKGSFPLYNEEEYLDSEFIKTALKKETVTMIKNNGIRNSHLLSIQPTGNTSIFANNVSGGLEPIFMPEYIRTSVMPYAPEGLQKPEQIDWINKKYTSKTKWRWGKEGDEDILKTDFEGYVWKYDKSRGLLRETPVMDYAVKFLKDKEEWQPEASWASTTTELTSKEHLDTMKVLSKYIDSAMSKTLNIPEDYSYQNFKDIYIDMYNSGTIKGGTTYRAGTMTTVLSKSDKGQEKDKGKRPKELPCDIHHTTSKGEKFTVLLGKKNEEPFEIFCVPENMATNYKKGVLVKKRGGDYTLKCGEDKSYGIFKKVTESMSGEHQNLTRMWSLMLKNNTPIVDIVTQINKTSDNITAFSKAVSRVLSKYIKDGTKTDLKCNECSSDNVVFEEGCHKCLDCGSSACG